MSSFASCEDAGAALRILGRSARALGADAVTIDLRQGGRFECIHEDASFSRPRGQDIALDASLAGWCIRHRRHAVIADLHAGGDDRLGPGRDLPAAMRSVTTLPLPRQAPVAAISLYWARPHAPSQEELHMLQSLGEVGVQLYLQLRRIEALQARLSGHEQRLAAAAQQLRAPLLPIRLALRLLQLRADGPKVLAYGRDIIQRQLQHLARLVGDLSGPASPDELSLRPARMDLTRALRKLAADVAPDLENMQRPLRLELPSQPVWLHADWAQLHQAFTQLLADAARATPGGGEVRLSMSCSHAPRMATVLVEAPPAAARIPGNEESPCVPGIDLGPLLAPGLGLQISRLIIERHRGSLSLDSAGPGSNRRVVVRLPAEPSDEPLPGL